MSGACRSDLGPQVGHPLAQHLILPRQFRDAVVKFRQLVITLEGVGVFLVVGSVVDQPGMLSGLNNNTSSNKKYSYSFEGEDQLAEIFDGITELSGEDQMLRRRVADPRAKYA